MNDAPRWGGHPWAIQDGRHDAHGARTWCNACNEWCSEWAGCRCCSEPAYEWLIAEARWEANYVRGMLAETTRTLRQPDIDGLEDAQALHPFPWERHDD